jgi:carboxylesterase type B
MSEDCLTLNVFTPAGQISRKKLLPVMVWLHGGAFQQGGSNRPEYQGKALVERDLIVVSVNYRLGALGFLVSSADGLYGNFGLMDQRAALDFISTNIQYFGGDPNQVTLFGESAGAVMIGLHLMMEGAGKLFQKVIMQSFPMGYTFRTPTVADFIGEAFKRSVDCRDLGCLRTERVEDLIKVQSGLMGIPRSVGDFFTWSPTLTQQIQVTIGPQGVIQTPFRTSQYVFRNQPINSQKWAAVNVSQPLRHLDLVPPDIPIIIGSNKHEGEIFVYNAFPAPMPKAVYWMFVGCPVSRLCQPCSQALSKVC